MWRIEMFWDGSWIVLESGNVTKDDASWKIAKWRQQWDCRKEGGFRAVEETDDLLEV